MTLKSTFVHRMSKNVKAEHPAREGWARGIGSPAMQSAGGIFTSKLAPKVAIRRAGSRIKPHRAPRCAKARFWQKMQGSDLYH